MRSDIDDIVDDLISRWHTWRSGYTLTKGFRSSDATCKDAQSQWTYHDRDNGVLDEQIETSIMRAVDRAVECIPNEPMPWHSMILNEARNLASAAAVWTSPRLPKDREEFAVLRLEARNKLLVELQRQGCIGG